VDAQGAPGRDREGGEAGAGEASRIESTDQPPQQPSTAGGTTSAAALRDYACRRDMLFPLPTTDHFFLNTRGHPLSAGNVSDIFGCIRQKAGIPVARRRQPRVHDLRHTFACKCLLSWLREGRDVSRSIHLLATYLGHAGVKETYWYLTNVPALMELVGQQFERYAAHGLRGANQ
jgi:integrase